MVTDDNGSLVSDATVLVREMQGIVESRVSVTTDAQGVYTTMLQGGKEMDAIASKTGFEETDRYVGRGGPNLTQNFRLHRIVRLSRGESTHVVVDSTDGMTGLNWEWVARTVRVTPPAGGAIVLEAVPDNPGVAACVDVQSLVHRCPQSRVTVASGSDIAVDVLLEWTAPARARALP